MRSNGSAQELERVRRRAVALVIEQGKSSAAVAEFLGRHVETVRDWVRTFRREGDAALAAKPHPGATPKLTPAQEAEVLSWLERSPTEFGFLTEGWTAPLVAQLVAERFGVRFHRKYMNAWLRKRHITLQRPRRVPRERNEPRIAAWRTDDWERLKKNRATSRRIWS